MANAVKREKKISFVRECHHHRDSKRWGGGRIFDADLLRSNGKEFYLRESRSNIRRSLQEHRPQE